MTSSCALVGAAGKGIVVYNAASRAYIYEARAEDTVRRVARRFAFDIAVLRSANPLLEIDSPISGQKLLVPHVFTHICCSTWGHPRDHTYLVIHGTGPAIYHGQGLELCGRAVPCGVGRLYRVFNGGLWATETQFFCERLDPKEDTLFGVEMRSRRLVAATYSWNAIVLNERTNPLAFETSPCGEELAYCAKAFACCGCSAHFVAGWCSTRCEYNLCRSCFDALHSANAQAALRKLTLGLPTKLAHALGNDAIKLLAMKRLPNEMSTAAKAKRCKLDAEAYKGNPVVKRSDLRVGMEVVVRLVGGTEIARVEWIGSKRRAGGAEASVATLGFSDAAVQVDVPFHRMFQKLRHPR
tara:strand:+ start:9681 stop:10742 length:1062 start_codon:yes stop_codon:yes gene_type:complete